MEQIMAEETVGLEESVSVAQSPLVSVTFQRSVKRKEKYLESEPKALGITQIGLSAFLIICISVFLSSGIGHLSLDVVLFISSLVVIVAGTVAIAAQKLHLPTLKACLGMQISACIASLSNIIFTVAKMEGVEMSYVCWSHVFENVTFDLNAVCQRIGNTQSHFFAGVLLLEVTVLAISITLVAYACKVVNCCGPAPKMPVIAVQALPVQQ
ncbi:unnamed protein product [Ophioblennius macclurei]